MHRDYLRFASVTALLLSSASALALPFITFDPRSMAMGGTGVAIGDPAIAPFFNPALLTATDSSKHFSLELPIIGMRLSDPGNLRSNLVTLSDDISALNTSITAANANASGATPAQLQLLPGSMTTVANNIDKVNSQLSSLNSQPLQGELGAATVIGIPGKNYGFAIYKSAWGAFGGTLEYNDATTLGSLSTSIRTAASALNNTTANAACIRVQNGTGTVAQLQADVQTCLAAAAAASANLLTAQGTVNFNTNTLASKIHMRLVTAVETGVSISHGFVHNDKAWSLGITPKVMQLRMYDALLSASNGVSTSGLTGDDYLASYSTINFDFGVAISYLNGWRTGFIVKNAIPQSFEFKSIAAGAASGSAQTVTGTLNLNPQVRTGTSFANEWVTLALDLDLTRNNPAGLENPSQYIGLGGEFSTSDWVEVRAGYRYDFVNPTQKLASFGMGFSPRLPYFKPHFDFAVSVSPDIFDKGWDSATQVGASLKAGFNF